MARTLKFTGEMEWPLEDGKQSAKLPLSMSLVYTSALAIEKVYAAPVADEALVLPMTSAKFLLLQALTDDVEVKVNGAATSITLKAGDGALLIWNPDGAVTAVTITVVTSPASLKGFAFA